MISFIVDWLGFAVCHQLSYKCLFYGDDVLGICARCTGIYMGLLAGVIVLAVMNRKRENGFPSWWMLVIGALGIGAMGLDGVSSYAGLRETTNIIRLITGLTAGAALPLVLVPMFNYQAWKDGSEEKILKTPVDFLVYTAGAVGLMFIVFQLRPDWLFWPMYIVTGLSIIFAFVYTNAILVMLLPWWSQKAESLRDLTVPLLIGAVLGFIELAGSYFMHWYLLSKLTGS